MKSRRSNPGDETLPISAYFRRMVTTPDGIAWIAVCVLSVAFLLDLLLNLEFIRLRDVADPGKAMFLLIVSPVLTFLILIRLRQLPFSSVWFASWVRGILCLAAFLLINF